MLHPANFKIPIGSIKLFSVAELRDGTDVDTSTWPWVVVEVVVVLLEDFWPRGCVGMTDINLTWLTDEICPGEDNE